MKKFCFYCLIWIIAAGFHQVLGQEKNHKPLVILDPGHGGIDSGAIGINGIKEKEVVLHIAREVIRLNKLLFNDTLQIYLTRYSDTLISLGDRTKLANALKADVFVSVHCNQSTRKKAQGIEVYFDGTDRKSEELAMEFSCGLNDKLGYRTRGVKYANFQVLRETPNIPSVLLELGFLSNWEEAEHNEKAHTIAGYALLILETLSNFLYHD
jgi:N-acetylmuramoyl-L-alanine amidase